jgi:DNA-binding NarL/FixJ family response regulator
MIRVLIADDHELIRMGLTRILTAEADIEVCGVAETGETAVELVSSCRPDVVLLDLTMPGAGGIAAAVRIRRADPQVRVMVVSCHDDAAHIRDAFAAGATAYILKDESSAAVVDAVRAVHQGEVRMSADAADALGEALGGVSGERSTRRERARRRW